jgi:hypothetical protein
MVAQNGKSARSRPFCFFIKSQYKKYIVCCTTCRILHSERAGRNNKQIQIPPFLFFLSCHNSTNTLYAAPRIVSCVQKGRDKIRKNKRGQKNKQIQKHRREVRVRGWCNCVEEKNGSVSSRFFVHRIRIPYAALYFFTTTFTFPLPSSAFGMVTFSTPSLYSASTLSSATASGMRTARSNEPRRISLL